MVHLQNGKGTAQQISLLVQYSSQRAENANAEETALSCSVPLRIMRTVVGNPPKGGEEEVKQSLQQ